jgi:hypothetical protein
MALWVDFVEVLGGCSHLNHYRLYICQVYPADVIMLERIEEALGIPLLCGLHTGVVIGRRPNCRSICRVSATRWAPPVVRKEFQGASLGNALDVNKALLYRLDEHLACWLARQAFTFPGPAFLVVFAVLLLS